MPFLNDLSLDDALKYVKDNCTHLYLCTGLPTTYDQASNTLKCGAKVGPALGAIGDRAPNGRKFTVAAIDDGVVACVGTVSAGFWALTSGTVLLAAKTLSAPQNVTDGNPFTLAAFDVGIPDAA